MNWLLVVGLVLDFSGALVIAWPLAQASRLELVLATGLALGSAATAATGWRVFATGTDRGDYGTFASAAASVQNPNALGIRVKGTSGPYEVNWMASCQGVTRPKAGVAVQIGVPQSATCSVNASVLGSKGGTDKIELLRR